MVTHAAIRGNDMKLKNLQGEYDLPKNLTELRALLGRELQTLLDSRLDPESAEVVRNVLERHPDVVIRGLEDLLYIEVAAQEDELAVRQLLRDFPELRRYEKAARRLSMALSFRVPIWSLLAATDETRASA